MNKNVKTRPIVIVQNVSSNSKPSISEPIMLFSDKCKNIIPYISSDRNKEWEEILAKK